MLVPVFGQEFFFNRKASSLNSQSVGRQGMATSLEVRMFCFTSGSKIPAYAFYHVRMDEVTAFQACVYDTNSHTVVHGGYSGMSCEQCIGHRTRWQYLYMLTIDAWSHVCKQSPLLMAHR